MAALPTAGAENVGRGAARGERRLVEVSRAEASSPFPLREGGPGVRSVAERIPAIRLTNPPSGEAEALRLTLMSGLLAAIHENAKHERAGLWLFELGRRYLPTPELATGGGLAQERRTLGVALTGPAEVSWATPERPADLYDLKGVAELLLRTLKVPAYRFTPAAHPTFHPGRATALEVMASPNPLTPFPEYREGGTRAGMSPFGRPRTRHRGAGARRVIEGRGSTPPAHGEDGRKSAVSAERL
jgi:hypothetical protein